MLHVIEKSRYSGHVDLIREATNGSVPAGVAARRLARQSSSIVERVKQ
jgi:hypothetical protein